MGQFFQLFLYIVKRKLVCKSGDPYKTCIFFFLENCFYSYIYISTLLFYYIHMMMITLYQTPPNMSSIGAVYNSLGNKFLSLLVDNLGATGKLRVNSSPVKVKLIIFPLFLPEGNAILPITPKAVCAVLRLLCRHAGKPCTWQPFRDDSRTTRSPCWHWKGGVTIFWVRELPTKGLLEQSPDLHGSAITSLQRRLQAQTLPESTPPLCKIPMFTKIPVTFEPMKRFKCPSWFWIS